MTESDRNDEECVFSPPAWSRQTSSSSTDSLKHQCSKSKKLRTRSNRSITSEDEKTYRLLVLGASSVGKTAVISQLLCAEIPADHTKTVQQMYLGKFGLCGPQVNVQIEDTSDAYFSDFPAMFQISLNTADGIILVFDISSPESFEEVKQIREAIIRKKEKIPIVVVANKLDLCPTTRDEAISATVLIDWECGYVECSAKENVNISDAFKELLEQITTIQGEEEPKKRSVSKHCFVRTQSSPTLPIFQRVTQKKEIGKLAKQQSCTIS